MRIITGDECGLLKEVIPELCRRVDPDSATSIHAGRARPSATSIQAAAASYGNYSNTLDSVVGGQQSAVAATRQRAVQRLENDEGAQSRQRGYCHGW